MNPSYEHLHPEPLQARSNLGRRVCGVLGGRLDSVGGLAVTPNELLALSNKCLTELEDAVTEHPPYPVLVSRGIADRIRQLSDEKLVYLLAVGVPYLSCDSGCSPQARETTR